MPTISNRQAKQIRESMAQTKPSEKRGLLMAMLGYSPQAKEAEALEATSDQTDCAEVTDALHGEWKPVN